MSQRRLIDFGSTVLADRINVISTALVEPGVLSGATFTVFDTSTLSISPHEVMLQSLLLIEDADRRISIPLTSEAKNYTVVYEHANQDIQGGAPAQLVLLEGLFSFTDLTNTVVLGWVTYPGGSVALSISFFIEAPKLRISNPVSFESDTLLSPYLPVIHLQEETPTPGLIVATDQYDSVETRAFMELENVSGLIAKVVQLFPFVSRLSPPERILLEANSELGTAVTATLIAEDGTSFSADNNVISNTSDLFEFREMRVLDLDASKFLPNRPYFVSLSSQINPGKKISISIVGANTNFLPF